MLRLFALAAAASGLVACVPSYQFGDATDASPPEDAPAPRDAGGDEDAAPRAKDAQPDVPVDAPPQARCAGAHGPAMVRFDTPSGSFCIDATEVTNAQFNEFLNAPGMPYDVPPNVCGMALAGGRPAPNNSPGTLQQPIGAVSYCDAWAYCAWAGKRLCGRIGGGMADRSGSLANEWVYACANGQADTVYPYGASYDPAACNTEGASVVLVDVASKTACHGTMPDFDHVFDMSGNVAEYDDFADGLPDDAGIVPVHARGGAVSEGSAARCAYEGEIGQYNRSFPGVGFRCCADAL